MKKIVLSFVSENGLDLGFPLYHDEAGDLYVDLDPRGHSDGLISRIVEPGIGLAGIGPGVSASHFRFVRLPGMRSPRFKGGRRVW